jgi:hypothetical protein
LLLTYCAHWLFLPWLQKWFILLLLFSLFFFLNKISFFFSCLSFFNFANPLLSLFLLSLHLDLYFFFLFFKI